VYDSDFLPDTYPTQLYENEAALLEAVQTAGYTLAATIQNNPDLPDCYVYSQDDTIQLGELDGVNLSQQFYHTYDSLDDFRDVFVHSY